MSWLSDTFLGARPDYRQIPGMQPYIDAIGEYGDVGIGRVGHDAKHDLKMFQKGRLEDVFALKPVLSAINARAASDYTTGERQMRAATAFENQPTLTAEMLGELSGKINQNAGLQYADAAKDVGANFDVERRAEVVPVEELARDGAFGDDPDTGRRFADPWYHRLAHGLGIAGDRRGRESALLTPDWRYS